MKKVARFSRRLYRAMSQLKSHKLMHKTGKQWVVIGMSALVLSLGVVALPNTIHAASIQNNNVAVKIQPKVQTQAKELHAHIIKHADQSHNRQDNNVKLNTNQSSVKMAHSNQKGHVYDMKADNADENTGLVIVKNSQKSKRRRPIKRNHHARRSRRSTRRPRIRRNHSRRTTRVRYVSAYTYRSYQRQIRNLQRRTRRGSRYSRRLARKSLARVQRQFKNVRIRKVVRKRRAKRVRRHRNRKTSLKKNRRRTRQMRKHIKKSQDHNSGRKDNQSSFNNGSFTVTSSDNGSNQQSSDQNQSDQSSNKSNKVDATHKYLVGSNDNSGQIISNDAFDGFKTNGSYSASSGNNGDLVHITNEANPAGKTFYQISDADGDNGWVYSGDLSNNPNGKAHPYDLSNMDNDLRQSRSSDIMSNYQQEIQAAREQNLQETNADRESKGLQPATEDPVLDQLAQLRSQQIVNDFSHVNSQGQFYGTLDAPQVNLPSDFNCAENIDETMPETNGKAAGDYANYAWWTKEKGATPDQDGGHRKNIEDPTNTKIGIGATYDTKSGQWYLAQDFGASQLDYDNGPSGYHQSERDHNYYVGG